MEQPTAAELQKRAQQASEIQQALNQFLALRHQPPKNPKSLLEFTALLIAMCPDMPSLYNFRQELIVMLEDPLPQLQQDWLLLNKLLKKCPKSYALWNYRSFVIKEALKRETGDFLYKKDWALCEAML